ncbi:putative hypothetical protein, partial [Schistosoma mansoni]
HIDYLLPSPQLRLTIVRTMYIPDSVKLLFREIVILSTITFELSTFLTR